MKYFLNTRLIYYKGGLILYRKDVDDESNITIAVKLIYVVGIGTYVISDDSYTLDQKITLKSLISIYKKVIDGYNLISKK